MMDGMSIADQFDEADAEPEIDDPATCDIEIDVVFQKKRFTVLHLEEPKAKHMERAERELGSKEPTPYQLRRFQMTLIAAVASVPIEVIGELPNHVVARAFAFLDHALGRHSPPTGEK